MAGGAHGATLVGLLEQLAAVLGALGDEGVVVVAGEAARAVQGAGDAAHGLVLGAGVGDALLVDGEGLGEEFVGDLFGGGLVGDLAGGEEEPQGEVGDGGGGG